MSPPNFRISKIGPESDAILRNLLQYYIHDMSEWFDVDTQPDGSYLYDTLSVWETGCHVYIAKIGDSLAGFAIVGSAVEWLGDVTSRDIHEFFVIRRFRRSGAGQAMARLLWREHPGEWLIRVLESNTPGLRFWRTIISVRAPAAYSEQQRFVNGRNWQFFRFVSTGA